MYHHRRVSELLPNDGVKFGHVSSFLAQRHRQPSLPGVNRALLKGDGADVTPYRYLFECAAHLGKLQSS